jgi:hypothetical protein
MSEKLNEKENSKEEELPASWKRIQLAVWLLGLAILAWQDWWWPGILVLLAISGLTQAGIQMFLSKKDTQLLNAAEEKKLTEERGVWLPDVCPNCGGPISVSTVNWSGPNTADCPYCKANLKKPA